MRSVLNASDEIGIASGESHYLSSGGRFGGPSGYRDRFAAAGDLRTDDGLRRVLDYLYSLDGRGFWARFAAETPRATLERELSTSDRTDRALFEVAIRHFSDGRPIAGEKTPDHIRQVPTLLSWFPGSRIVHTLRDPRAIFLSAHAKEADWIARGEFVSRSGRVRRRLGPLGRAYQVFRVAADFKRVVRYHDEYTARYPNRYCLVRFEDLVTEPDATVRALSAQLGVPYDTRMLDQVVRNASFSPRGAHGFDPGAADRWRGQMRGLTRRSFAVLCGRRDGSLRVRAVTAPPTTRSRTRVVLLATRAYSGSTLLAALLGSHDDVATVSEVSGHQRQHRMATFQCSCGRLMTECPFWAEVAASMRRQGFADFDLSNFRLNFSRGHGSFERLRTGSLRWTWAEDVRDAAFNLVPGNSRAMRELGRRNVAFAQTVLDVVGASVFVDASKERMRIRYASRYMDADIRVIHLVRDVRGVVDSVIRHVNGPVDIAATARHWARTNETLRRHGEWLGAERYRLVRYEDLCARPAATLHSLFEFCGAPERHERHERARAAPHRQCPPAGRRFFSHPGR